MTTASEHQYSKAINELRTRDQSAGEKLRLPKVVRPKIDLPRYTRASPMSMRVDKKEKQQRQGKSLPKSGRLGWNGWKGKTIIN